MLYCFIASHTGLYSRDKKFINGIAEAAKSASGYYLWKFIFYATSHKHDHVKIYLRMNMEVSHRI